MEIIIKIIIKKIIIIKVIIMKIIMGIKSGFCVLFLFLLFKVIN